MKCQIELIRNLIGEGDLNQAFSEIEKSPNIWINPVSQDSVLLIKSNYSYFKESLVKGMISNNDFQVERNKIVANLLELLREIERVIEFHEKNLQNNPQANIEEKIIRISKYLEIHSFLKKIKLFFSQIKEIEFTLYSVKTSKYYNVICPENISTTTASKYLGEIIFPELKDQHFVWKLERRNNPIINLESIQNTNNSKGRIVNITAEYKFHDELWGAGLKRKIVMEKRDDLTSDFYAGDS